MSATARIKVTFEISLTDSWGEDCSVAQIRKQTMDKAREACDRIERLSLTGAVYKQRDTEDVSIMPNERPRDPMRAVEIHMDSFTVVFHGKKPDA